MDSHVTPLSGERNTPSFVPTNSSALEFKTPDRTFVFGSPVLRGNQVSPESKEMKTPLDVAA
jgi:hypothetical protein